MGYCGVCDRQWKLPAGTPCPKHEVLLDDGASDARLAQEAGAAVEWVTIATFGSLAQAIAPRLRLDAEGIPTFLDGERVAGEVAYTFATGGVRLQVPAAHAAAALESLSRCKQRSRRQSGAARSRGRLGRVWALLATLISQSATEAGAAGGSTESPQ
jgi:hypothetical protein